jgi:hypothetical protein
MPDITKSYRMPKFGPLAQLLCCFHYGPVSNPGVSASELRLSGWDDWSRK